MEILGRRSVYILALSRNLFILLLLLDTFFLVFSFINVLFKKATLMKICEFSCLCQLLILNVNACIHMISY